MNRRTFLKAVPAVTAVAAASTCGLEVKTLSAAQKTTAGLLPLRKIGNVAVSRLIVGGNPFSGNAHSRDLPYVSSLMKRYFTDEKCVETLHICEQCGINTAQLRTDSHIVRIMDRG